MTTNNQTFSAFATSVFLCLSCSQSAIPAERPEQLRSVWATNGYKGAFHHPSYPRNLRETVRKLPDGTFEAVGLTAYYPILVTKYSIGKASRDIYVGYPPLRHGDVLPVFNYIYWASPQEPIPGSRSVSLLLATVEDMNLPKGVTIQQPDALSIPVTQIGHDHSHVRGHMLWVKSADAPPNGKGDATALVWVNMEPHVDKQSIATVKAGDYLVFGGSGHKVRAVVPKNPKTQVIGWVEFDPKPVPEADLRKAGERVVVPADPKKR